MDLLPMIQTTCIVIAIGVIILCAVLGDDGLPDLFNSDDPGPRVWPREGRGDDDDEL